MPYRKLQDGQMEFTGKCFEWLVDFEKWHKQDLGDTPKIEFPIYLQHLLLFYISFAKEKWKNSIFSKSKIITLESIATKYSNGFLTDVIATLDFLAENLKSEDRINNSQKIRTNILNHLVK